MNYRFEPAALDQYEEAAAYYRGIRWDLAEDFAHEVERAIERVAQFPRAYPQVEEDIRRCVVDRFHYLIYYTIEADESILVVAVVHGNRGPAYVRRRLRRA